MSRYAVFMITLIVLMALAPFAFSAQPIHLTRPMVPAPPPPVGPTPAFLKSSGCSLPAAQCLASVNWSGYAVTNDTDTDLFSFVNASWTVPAIAGASGTSCPDPVRTWLDASFWVGLDGFSNGYVEQTGTSADCVYGHVEYYPWYEFYPAISYPLPSKDVIYPGDIMYAYVNYTSPNFGIWLQDKNKGHTWQFSLLGTNPGAPRDSAEWITEGAAGCITSDCSYFNFLALTDFFSVTFTRATATRGTSSFSVSNTSWDAYVYWIEVTTVFYPPPPPPFLGPYLRARPTATTDGGEFSVYWVSSGP